MPKGVSSAGDMLKGRKQLLAAATGSKRLPDLPHPQCGAERRLGGATKEGELRDKGTEDEGRGVNEG